ncbi:hypothetical protein RSOLAG1IB_01279 [Rhizoctonia solani AG-1 IB]|uniref:Uncharacterized protein n=1 Tax=Thanatephorus cucumeris (strain AG1-IB / isolate 7/3/14) TaxID=1108050 RepID=A0A0B7FCG7_THACB|nr:hypothetical protein RSOLAG1IB_01279 [Rhizoctonia solani AG-1 IB]
MFESSLALEATAALFKIAMLSSGLVFSLTLLTENFVPSLIVLWGICIPVFGALVLNFIWRLQVSMLVIQYDASDVEATHMHTTPVLSSLAPENVEPKSIVCSVACGPKGAPVHCSPLEMLNKLSSEIDTLGPQEIQTTFTALAEDLDDDCTFVTSPFTRPLLCTMEVFVCKEEIVVYEDAVNHIPSGIPSPFVVDRDLPHILHPDPTKLIEHCEAANMEPDVQDM